MRPEFAAFQKIPRLRRTIVVTEKIDGTNGQICVTADGEVYAGSRNRWLTPESDNAGFCRWVTANGPALAAELGEGTHYGEWWGSGIARGYGLSELRTDQNGRTRQSGNVGEKRFSLFNTARWSDKPAGLCSVVPVLYIGAYSDGQIESCLIALRTTGSVAQPGFMQPEGVVVYMQASGTMHKVLLEGDQLPKGFLVKAERGRA